MDSIRAAKPLEGIGQEAFDKPLEVKKTVVATYFTCQERLEHVVLFDMVRIAAEAFFDDTVHTIGAFVVGPELDIDMDFYFTGSKSGQGYGFDFLIGANAAFEPPNPIPEPGTLLVFASGLLVLLVSPHAAARLRRRA